MERRNPAQGSCFRTESYASRNSRYLRRFTEGLAPSMIPDKCQLFSRTRPICIMQVSMSISTRDSMEICSRQSGPDYMGYSSQNVAAGSQMRQFTIIKDDIGHGRIVALKRELHSLDEINATIRPTTPNAQGLWTVSDDTISRACNHVPILSKVDSVRIVAVLRSAVSSDIVKTANVLYDIKIQRAITLLRAFGDGPGR